MVDRRIRLPGWPHWLPERVMAPSTMGAHHNRATLLSLGVYSAFSSRLSCLFHELSSGLGSVLSLPYACARRRSAVGRG